MGKPPRCSMERTWGANSSNCLPGPFAAQDNEIFGVCSSYWHMNNLRMVCGCVNVPFHWDHWRIQWILKMTAHTHRTVPPAASAELPSSLTASPQVCLTPQCLSKVTGREEQDNPHPTGHLISAELQMLMAAWRQKYSFLPTEECTGVRLSCTGGLIKPLCPIRHKWSTFCSHTSVVLSKPPQTLPPQSVHGLAGGTLHIIQLKGGVKKTWQSSRVIRQNFTCQNSRFTSSLEFVRMLWLKRNTGWHYDWIYCNGICSIRSFPGKNYLLQ